MSLINQALRKAQRDRSPDRMPEPGAQTPAQVAQASANGMRPGLVMGLVIALAVLVGLVAGLSILLFRGTPEATSAAAPEVQPSSIRTEGPSTTNEAVAAASQPQTPGQAMIEEPLAPVAQSVKEPEPAFERESTSPVVEELRRAREAAEAKAREEALLAQAKLEAEQKAAEEAAARAAAKPSQEIIDWLARAKISGVKLSDSESKVILNGNSYAVGEYVNYALGLKVMIIQQTRVLFVDNNGKKYLKKL